MPYEFDRPASEVLRDTLSGGVNLPWNLPLLAWLSHRLLQWAGQLPWEQTLQQAKELQVPAIVAP